MIRVRSIRNMHGLRFFTTDIHLNPLLIPSTSKMASSRICRITGILLCAIGLPILAGGGWLFAHGGSWYYVISGIALIASGVLLIHLHENSLWIYIAFLLTTLICSFYESGFYIWALIPRLTVPLGLGILVVLCAPGLKTDRAGRRIPPRLSYLAAGILAAALVGLGACAFIPHSFVTNSRATAPAPQPSRTAESSEWHHYGRTPAATRFSPAAQITPSNVNQLQIAWIYRMGGAHRQIGEHQTTPLQVGRLLYLCTERSEVIALDAESGRQIWRFNPHAAEAPHPRCRGVSYYEVRKAATHDDVSCPQRILTTTIDARLIALDARTGNPCPHFGDHGTVDLKAGMGAIKPQYYFQTSAPLVARDLIVIGGFVCDGITSNMPSGVIRAFNAKTGELAWAWDPGNPAITGLPPVGQTYTPGAPNMWSAATYDDVLGLIYVPLGTPTGATDFWGSWRSAAIEKYANSVVALDVLTGRPRWHFQTVHHDLWDYDLPPQPTLSEVPDGKGGRIPALIQATKRGQIFLLDRRNGTPLAEVLEKRVPQGGQPDDRTSPTQPYSTGMPAIGTEPLTEARMWGLTPFDQLWCRIQFRRLRYEGEFTPPTRTRRSLTYPGPFGGMNWGGVSVDERRGILIVNDIRLPYEAGLLPRGEYNRALERKQGGGGGVHGWPTVPLPPEAPYGSAGGMFVSPLGVPCNEPPWGTLTAIDLGSRKLLWQRPIGTAQDTGPFGIKLRLALPLGMPTLGGSLVTETGLIFFAGTQDYYLRALEVETGRDLWKARLPVGAQATPMTYIAPKSQRQFVVIVAGGAALSKDKGDYVIAYSLPNRS